MPKSPITVIGPWSEMKIQIVRDYAKEYSLIMKNQSWLKNYAYLDGFAGAGQHKSKATGEIIDGSPRAVLAVEPPFPEYHFVELDPARAGFLADIGKLRPGRVTIHPGDANEKLLSDVLPRFRRELFTRALLLLDPYNIGIDWRVTEAVGKSRAIDMFFNFMVMDANMNALRLERGKIHPTQAARMTRFWGDSSWETAMYKAPAGLLPGFDGLDMTEKQSNDTLASAFADRLKSSAGFTHVAKPLPVRNETGQVVYYLFYASHNATGLKIASAIFNKWRG